MSAFLPLVPAGVRVSVGCAAGADALVRSWFGGAVSVLLFSVASGRFGSGRSAFALGRGRRVLLWLPAGSRPPVWAGVSWSLSAVPGGCWWLGVPAPRVVSLSLF
ncbi:MAG: hypothetical protein AAGE84_28155 [Cyanobacteria bacterium P01_G01_bin.39]